MADLTAPELEKLDESLLTAASYGSVEKVSALISAGAQVNYHNSYPITPLHEASGGGHCEVAKILLSHHAIPDVIDTYGHTPLHRASGGGHTEVVQILLSHHANPDITDTHKWTALWLASREGYSEIVKILLSYGADPDIADNNGSTPLLQASTKGHTEVFKILLSYNADPHIVDKEGNTMCHLACKNGHSKVLEYQLENELFAPDIQNNDNETPRDIVIQLSDDFLVSHGREECRRLLKLKGLYEGPLKRVELLTKTYNGVSEVTGIMKVVRILLHGPPLVGKTSVKHLILGNPPIKNNSTGLIEDPVRAISTVKMSSVQETSLEEIDEKKMISMIQSEVREVAEKKSKLQLSTDTVATDQRYNSKPTKHPATIQSSSSTSTEQIHTSHSTTRHCRSEVLSKIAADLDSVDPGATSLFACKHVFLIDSGGQPQFSNLLPLVLQSQSHHHMVVIRLDEKLSDRPKNCFGINGINYSFPECLLLTNYQLIERVCQLAAGYNSIVIVIGTHLDLENPEEPLAKKNELLAPLMKKYMHNFVRNKGKPIFAVNAMIPKGEIRTRYSKMLRSVILSAPVIPEQESKYSVAKEGNKFGAAEEGLVVPLRWIVLELELSRSSKNVGILNKSEIIDIAQELKVTDLDKALAFFRNLGIHYHYPEILSEKIFTSVTPISSRLSKIVETTFPYGEQFREDPDRIRLQKTGEMTKKFLRKIMHCLKSVDDQFAVEDFIHLMIHLHMLFEIEDGAFLFPSLLPLETQNAASSNKFHQEPLFLFWLDDNNDKVRILPQSFFHALMVNLLKRNEIRLDKSVKHSRTNFTFNMTLENADESQIVLTDCVFWIELRSDEDSDMDECKFIKSLIRSCTQCVLEQLKLSNLGNLLFGITCSSKDCEIRYPHPGKCQRLEKSKFSCVVSESSCKWQERSEQKLIWFKATVSSDDSNNINEDEPCAPPKSPRSVFRDNFATICDLVTETTKFANDLSTARLISEPTRDNVATNALLNRYEKVDACMGEIRHLVSVEMSPRPIESLCDVLKKQSNTSLDILADKMLKELGKQSKIKRTCVKKTSPARQNSSDDSSLHLKKRKVDLSQDNAVVTDKNGRVSSDKIRILNRKLWPIHPNWEQFGRELALNDTVIRHIGSSRSEDIRAQFQTAIIEWKKQGDTRTWRVVHDALLEIHRKDIADDIKEKHNLDDDVPHTKDSYVADMTHALKDVIPEWESFARSLGLDDSTIQIIKGDEKTCFSDLLRKWIQEKGHDADIHCMLSACEKIDKDLADRLRIDEEMCSAFPVLGKMKQEQ